MSFARSLRESLCLRSPAAPEACDNSRRPGALAPPCSVRKSMGSAKVEQLQTARPRSRARTRDIKGHARRTILVDVLREPWQGAIPRQRIFGIDPLVPPIWSRAGSLEAGDGIYRRPRRDSRSCAGGSLSKPRSLAYPRFFLPTCRARGIPTSALALGLAVVDWLEMGRA